MDAATSLKIKGQTDVALPRLEYWNYEACRRHKDVGPQVACEYRACGGEFFAHQRVGIAWLYAVGRGLVGDVPGAGKTNVALGLLALLKERRELTGRAVIVCQTPAVLQWLEETQRWTTLSVEAVYSGLTRQQRISRYIANWDVLIIGYHMLLQDVKLLMKLEPSVLIVDDVDPLHDHQNKTHRAIVALSKVTTRSAVFNATTVQTRLEQLHAALVPVGGHDVFGGSEAFKRRYLRQEPVTIFNMKTGRKFTQMKTTGHRNGDELKEKLSPLFLRRNYDELTDVRMPEVMPAEDVWLDLHPAQRRKYDLLQTDVLELIKEDGKEVKRVAALAKFTYGQEICAGLSALGEEDGPEASVKLDWVVDQLTGTWHDEKIVVFIKNVGVVKALQARLTQAGIGFATVWGLEPDASVRAREVDRFWTVPGCRAFIGTSAIERSLNLQVANIVVNVDTHLNPARMTQILGRARRAGSKHTRLFTFNLFCRATQEEFYLNVLRRREALASYVYSEGQEMYEQISPLELLQLISP